MGAYKLSSRSLFGARTTYSSMLVGNTAYSPSSFDLLETQVLGSSTASVTFSSLSSYASTYQHLQIRYTGVFTTYGEFYMTFNGDTSDGNYYNHTIYSTGSGIGVSADANRSYSYQWNGGMNVTIIDILDPFKTNKYKASKAISGNTLVDSGTNMYKSHLWKNTAAITSITLQHIRENLPAGARFSLYGMKVA